MGEMDPHFMDDFIAAHGNAVVYSETYTMITRMGAKLGKNLTMKRKIEN